MLKKSEYKPSVLDIADIVRNTIIQEENTSNEQVLRIVADTILEIPYFKVRKLNCSIKYIKLVYQTLRCELEILQEFLDDINVTEIMVNGPKDVFIERNGNVERADIEFENKEHLERIIQRLAARVGREINELNPIVDARLIDGSRINAVFSNVSIDGPTLTIRKFTKSRMTIEELISQGDVTKDASEFLKIVVECGYNIFVCGGTSSGKTTFLNVLSDYIPKEERVIVIEDSAELQIRGHENLVRMEVKASNSQGKGAINMRDLIKTSLRMRPDRIIVGEVRGDEVIDMIAAMSTGHDGSLSTGHSNSARGMIKRLETMYLSASNYPIEAVRGSITEALDIIIHLKRYPDGHRRISEISEFLGYENGVAVLNELFKYEQEKGLVKTKNDLSRKDKLRQLYS